MASARWERRNQRAQALGYQSYYDYRAHDNGRLPPDQPRPTGELLARQRGHRSAADLERLLRQGKVEIIAQYPIGGRDEKTGQFRQIEVEVILTDGSQKTFRFRGKQLKSENLEGIRAGFAAAGVEPYGVYMDVLGLSGADLDALDELEEDEAA